MQTHARQIINLGRMGLAQWLVILVTMGLNAMDGFDVLSIAFASPGIAAEWGIPSSGLGVVLSMELIGMAFGEPSKSVGEGEGSSAPLIAHLALVLCAGIYLPAALVAWLQHVARLLG